MSLNVLSDPTIMSPDVIGRIVKEARLQKPLTQKELAELAGISLRSLQRIENGEVRPRAYTWRHLGTYIDLQARQPTNLSMLQNEAKHSKLNLPRKWILSISVLAVIILSFSAFVIQSPTFPETLFETLNMILAGCVIYAALLYKIWK